MTSERLEWSTITDRRSAAGLQSFTCTVERPRTPAGRRLPHPVPWEWEAQALLRNASHRMRAGDELVVGRVPGEDVIAAGAWLEFHELEVHEVGMPAVYITSSGVHVAHRGCGGHLADELVDRVIRRCRAVIDPSGAPSGIVHGKVHVRNVSCENLQLRHGFEPVGLPQSTYQEWALLVDRA